jgi:hypothetical protein
MQPCFLTGEAQHVNSIDRFVVGILARWWRLGILALARIALKVSIPRKVNILSGRRTQIPLLGHTKFNDKGENK